MRSPKTTAQLIHCKTRTDYAYKLRVQDFATGKNFSFNQYPKQRFLLFSRDYFLWAGKNIYSTVANPRLIVSDLHNCLAFFVYKLFISNHGL